MSFIWKSLVLLFLVVPVLAEPLPAEPGMTTAAQAKLSPEIVRELAKLKSRGVTEILVPTWFPQDLKTAVGKVDVSDPNFGPNMELVWSSSKTKAHSLVLRGAGGGLGGPGPDSTTTVNNPVIGPIELWTCIESPMMYRYGTGFGLSVPRGRDGNEYFLDIHTIGKSDNGLSKFEMQKILASMRKLKI